MNQKQKKIVLALCGIAVLSLIAAGLYLACGRKSLQKNNPQTDKQVVLYLVEYVAQCA